MHENWFSAYDLFLSYVNKTYRLFCRIIVLLKDAYNPDVFNVNTNWVTW